MSEKIIFSKGCPADAIRDYIESLIATQKPYVVRGDDVPQELLIPQQIILSPENIQFLLDSQLVDFYGSGPTGNEFQFFWRKSERFPALEIRVEKMEDGTTVLSYMREKASDTKEEFVWDKNETSGKTGVIKVSKLSDDLDDVYQMNF